MKMKMLDSCWKPLSVLTTFDPGALSEADKEPHENYICGEPVTYCKQCRNFIPLNTFAGKCKCREYRLVAALSMSCDTFKPKGDYR